MSNLSDVAQNLRGGHTNHCTRPIEELDDKDMAMLIGVLGGLRSCGRCQTLRCTHDDDCIKYMAKLLPSHLRTRTGAWSLKRLTGRRWSPRTKAVELCAKKHDCLRPELLLGVFDIFRAAEDYAALITALLASIPGFLNETANLDRLAPLKVIAEASLMWNHLEYYKSKYPNCDPRELWAEQLDMCAGCIVARIIESPELLLMIKVTLHISIENQKMLRYKQPLSNVMQLDWVNRSLEIIMQGHSQLQSDLMYRKAQTVLNFLSDQLRNTKQAQRSFVSSDHEIDTRPMAVIVNYAQQSEYKALSRAKRQEYKAQVHEFVNSHLVHLAEKNNSSGLPALGLTAREAIRRVRVVGLGNQEFPHRMGGHRDKSDSLERRDSATLIGSSIDSVTAEPEDDDSSWSRTAQIYQYNTMHLLRSHFSWKQADDVDKGASIRERDTVSLQALLYPSPPSGRQEGPSGTAQDEHPQDIEADLRLRYRRLGKISPPQLDSLPALPPSPSRDMQSRYSMMTNLSEEHSRGSQVISGSGTVSRHELQRRPFESTSSHRSGAYPTNNRSTIFLDDDGLDGNMTLRRRNAVYRPVDQGPLIRPPSSHTVSSYAGTDLSDRCRSPVSPLSYHPPVELEAEEVLPGTVSQQMLDMRSLSMGGLSAVGHRIDSFIDHLHNDCTASLDHV